MIIKKCSTEIILFIIEILIKKTLWPLFIGGVQLSEGNRATTRRQFSFYY